jgi:hypothetical protein
MKDSRSRALFDLEDEAFGTGELVALHRARG